MNASWKLWWWHQYTLFVAPSDDKYINVRRYLSFSAFIHNSIQFLSTSLPSNPTTQIYKMVGHSKTPGGSGISEKEAKKQAQSKSLAPPLPIPLQITNAPQSTVTVHPTLPATPSPRPLVRPPLPPTQASPTSVSTTAAISPERRALVVFPCRTRALPTPTWSKLLQVA
jgi:hypothetical protein